MLLSLKNVHKSYAAGDSRVEILRGVSLELNATQSLALMGESGSGKSTLLHLIGGLDVPDTGTITLNEHLISDPRDTVRASLRRGLIGIVFQQFNLIPSLTVAQNIAFQAQLSARYDADWCAQLADRMGLSDQLRKYPDALSGGQQQRVAIARALAAKPTLLLADEPTGNLDEDTSRAVLDLMLEITADTGTALLMVTHSAAHAAALQSIVTLSGGQITP